jgi:hypothetical protein
MRQTLKLSLVLLILVCVTHYAPAQEVGFHDFSLVTSHGAADHVPSPQKSRCHNPQIIISDGPPPPLGNENLTLSITEVTPEQLEFGGEFEVAIRLMNESKATTGVPWEADVDKTVVVSSDGTEESHVIADIYLHLQTSSKRDITLNASAELFGNYDLPWTYVVLKPGEWVNIKLKGKVECDPEGSCGKIKPGDTFGLIAEWGEREVTHAVKGCTEERGNNPVRALHSASSPVAVRGVDSGRLVDSRE